MIRRKSYARIKDVYELPKLTEIQLDSYETFLQPHASRNRRKKQGLEELFQEVFPIESGDGNYKLEYINYSLGKLKYDINECPKRDASYAGALRMKLRLKTPKESKEQEVYLGDIPFMTENGTFIVNGDERVVVSQLHRSPGISFEESTHPSGKKIFSARIIPYRGAWIEFLYDVNDTIHVTIDRKRKFIATLFLRIFGLSKDEDIIKSFSGIESVKLTQQAKMEEYFGCALAENLIDTESNAILSQTGDVIDKDMAKRIWDAGIRNIKILKKIVPDIVNTLEKDHSKSKEEAMLDIYRKLRPSDPPTIDSAKTLLDRMFHDPKRYDLGKVGRYVLNRKLGMNTPLDYRLLNTETIVTIIKALIDLKNGERPVDDIDHLGNRRIRSVGELLLNQIRIGMSRLEKTVRERMNLYDLDNVMPHNLVNAKLVSSVIKDFFGRGQLSQFMDQTNPLSELTHKRRLSALGPGGLNRERAGFEVRDVHYSHYGRMCPIETPEGPNIGLIASLSTYARVNEFGFLETPYRRVDNGKVTNRIEYLSADVEDKYIIAQANAKLDSNGKFAEDRVFSRYKSDFIKASSKEVHYMDVSPRQLVSIAASLIPFLEHDDANRALMGSNMQRQSVPLLETDSPLVGTGMEHKAAKDSGTVIVAEQDGKVTYVDSNKIVVSSKTYHLRKFERSNANTTINQRPIVKLKDRVKAGDILADGAGTKNGEIALGRNTLVAFMPWRGYNFEDAILISKKLVKNDAYTSLHILEFEIEARDTRLGNEEITRDIPNVGEDALMNLDKEGIVCAGAEVKPGDVLVGKVTPKSETELSPEEKLLRAIFGEKAGDVRDASLTVPPGVEGIVIEVRSFARKDPRSKTKEEKQNEAKEIKKIDETFDAQINKLEQEKTKKLQKLLVGQKLQASLLDNETGKILIKYGKTIRKSDLHKIETADLENLKIADNPQVENEANRVIKLLTGQIDEVVFEKDREVDRVKRGDELPPGVLKKVKVYVASKKRLSVGDKMAGRHGNKGVVAKILPEEDMPFLEDGTPVEIVLNPLGVPSRMNVGQILETHLGWAAKILGFKVATPVFDGATEAEIVNEMKKAKLPEDGKVVVYDGLTGDAFDQKVTVGYIYMLKLAHLVDDKIHARSIGPYSLVTQQPLGGKAQFGGQRFGEMEVWALEAYGAAYTLQELLTVKSDDIVGRTKIYESIVKGESDFQPGTPESFNVLVKELQSLAIDVNLIRKDKKEKEAKTEGLTKFDAISVKIASSEIIKEWSKGEVKKPETINYRTLKPEKDGLFCEKIFGPTKDFECNCGKYKRIKHKGIVCDRCGVEVTRSSVRRERMGHIDLAVPVSHVWFFKAVPSKIGNLLQINTRELEKVLYYEEYIVVDAGETPLKERQLLNEERYLEARKKYGANSFTAKMGAEAIKLLLEKIDLTKLTSKLRKEMKETKAGHGQKKILKILKIVESFKKSTNNPAWMILNAVPVIPPDLRPLVPLDGGRFATSDLNDLYRRVINRNNRLKKLLELNAPDVIVRNEKRMLQEAVDALFDNGRHGRPVLGPGNRPLKSISDMLKGKQGRFRQNLLGKRVDYSGRSVIVVGPDLSLSECGLPKKMALELFEPFIIRKLKDKGFVHTIKSAKKMVEKTKLEVWDILDEVIKDHPVLLNRAPTLHRLGIQAFQPKLIEGNAITIHPLVCAAFNADFDGDQMAVHVPLSLEAQIESKVLMMARNNIFSPANGRPIVVPSQDIVLGCYYLTQERSGCKSEGKIFADKDEVVTAFQDKQVEMHAKIKVRINNQLVPTTAGRVIFNNLLPADFPYVNTVMTKSELSKIIEDCYAINGHEECVSLLDNLKRTGFEEATKAGISISVNDLKTPPQKKEIIKKTLQEVAKVEDQYKKGFITDGERYNKIIDLWTHTTDSISDLVFEGLDKFNPIFMMARSGARGSKQQIRQLAGMRGLMAKPSGEILETPITANFREGLTVLEYFISTHGARKGLADTALKTADSGYLTRRLVDVSQDVIITEEDCGTLNGIFVSAIVEGDEIVIALAERIVGRIAQDNITDIITDEIIIKSGEEITEKTAKRIEELGLEKIRLRSVLTCESKRGICAKCYGRNLATLKLGDIGEAVGVIAAQSIGEPGTQLTMRTFHIGGTASRIIEQSYLEAKNNGIMKYHGVKAVPTKKESEVIVLNRNAQISINDADGRELERYPILQGSILYFKDAEKVKKGNIYVRWDPYNTPIISEVSGKVKYEDIKSGVTMHEEIDPATGLKNRVIVEHKGDYHPQLIIMDKNGDVAAIYAIPVEAHILAANNKSVQAGEIVAKRPRVVTKTKDITGGLPRVAELFEARRPKNPAIISEIDGEIEFIEPKKGLKRIIVKSQTGMTKEYTIPHGKHLNVYKGDKVYAGQQLIDGPVVPQDILKVSGEQKLQEYLVNEVQQVYRLQGVRINDKHIEIIVRQMLKKVKIDDPGDTAFLTGEQIDKIRFQEENKQVQKKKGKPASALPILLGITKASLSTESFISAASFQETTRVLTDAAASGKTDYLHGLKENIIMGHLIPAGTGFEKHRNIEMIKHVLEEKKEDEKKDDKKTDEVKKDTKATAAPKEKSKKAVKPKKTKRKEK